MMECRQVFSYDKVRTRRNTVGDYSELVDEYKLARSVEFQQKPSEQQVKKLSTSLLKNGDITERQQVM